VFCEKSKYALKPAIKIQLALFIGFVKIFFMQNEKESSLKNKKIALGVCSSIAIYKSAELTSRLVKLGADVSVVMTENASKLMSPRIFQTLSRNRVCVSMWEEISDWKPEHISLAESIDLLLVAPATANAIGNFANGIAPDMLSTLYLATKAKVLIAPAMNCDMYSHPAVQKNMKTLEERGVEFVETQTGMLACGRVGAGKLADVDEIIKRAEEVLSK
jgi:phosphopantothenoylcysteine synthetase/decarboxylase